MDEPSVLDYVKSKLTFWRKSSLHLPPPEDQVTVGQPTGGEANVEQIDLQAPAGGSEPPAATVETIAEPLPPVTIAPQVSSFSAAAAAGEAEPVLQILPIPASTSPVSAVPAGAGVRVEQVSWRIPWFAVISLGLVLLAQLMLEPRDNRDWTSGAAFYALAFVALIWAYGRAQWTPPPLPEEHISVFPLTYRRDVLIAAVPLALVAFLLFGGGKFTLVNFGLWVLSTALFVRALWVSGPPQARSWFGRAWNFVSQPRWGLVFSRWTLVLALALAVIIFFRVYRMYQVPSDMISDHAEKLLDIYDVLHGQPSIFFPRNTGREAFQFYLTAAIILLFKTGYTYISLKIGTIAAGIFTLPFIYLLGKELGNRRVGLVALFFAGIAYWPNVISRFGLRFPLYPLFVAPTLYYLVRGLRRMNRNDFVLSGIFLGIGLHGYTPIRALPFVVILAVALYVLHRQSKGYRREAFLGLVLVGFFSLVVFLPLLRYALENPTMFFYRTATRMGTLERPLPGPALTILLENTWRSLTMFFWSDGVVWVQSIPMRPALDFISAGLFFAGLVLVLVRYIRNRHWVDLFLLLSIPVLMLPSILSLAFPDENPSLVRSGGAIVPVFILVGLALDGFLSSLNINLGKRAGLIATWVVGLGLAGWSMANNYDLVFNQYAKNYTQSAWNTSEMGEIVRFFSDAYGEADTAWVVAYPHWVDTRLVGMTAGFTTRDMAIWPDHIIDTSADPRAKLFLVYPQDTDGLNTLRQIYPEGIMSLHKSRVETKDFYIFMVPPRGDSNVGN